MVIPLLVELSISLLAKILPIISFKYNLKYVLPTQQRLMLCCLLGGFIKNAKKRILRSHASHASNLHLFVCERGSDLRWDCWFVSWKMLTQVDFSRSYPDLDIPIRVSNVLVGVLYWSRRLPWMRSWPLFSLIFFFFFLFSFSTSSGFHSLQGTSPYF